MALQPNARINQIQPSATMAITAQAKAMKAAGEDVIGFGAGEPDFDTPTHIAAAGIAAIENGDTRYTAGAGTVALRQAFADRIAADYGVQYDAADVVASNGAKQSVFNLLYTVLEPGEKVIILAPYWVSYPDMIRLAGGEPVVVEGTFENGFRVTPEQIEAAIDDNTVGIILNNPSNPTGVGYDLPTLEAIAKTVSKHDLWVISDEIYDKLIFGDHKHYCFAGLSDEMYARTATVNGVSKAYAMTGWRIGCAAGPSWWIKAAAKLQGQTTSGPSSMSQAAATVALSGDQAVVESMRVEFEKRRDLIVGLLNDIPGIECISPQGAFYVFPKITGALGPYADDMEWTAALLAQQKVAVVPGLPFDGPGHIRMSYATSEDAIRKGCARIKEFVANL